MSLGSFFFQFFRQRIYHHCLLLFSLLRLFSYSNQFIIFIETTPKVCLVKLAKYTSIERVHSGRQRKLFNAVHCLCHSIIRLTHPFPFNWFHTLNKALWNE